MTILLLGSGRGARSAGGGSVPGPEASAFLARTSGLDATHTNAYTDLINGLVTDGIWSKLDALYIYATQDQTTALLNLVSSSYNAAKHGTPTFTADRGFTGTDSSSTIYLDSGFNPSTATSPKYTQNSGHMSAWNVNNAWAAYGAIGVIDFGSGHNSIVVPQDSGSGYGRLSINSAGVADNITISNASGHFIANRSGSNARQGYRNGSSSYTGSDGSIAPMNFNIFMLGYNSNGTPAGSGYQQAMNSIGASLSSTDATNFYNRLRTYMTAVGVP